MATASLRGAGDRLTVTASVHQHRGAPMDNRFFPLVVVTAMLALGMTLTVADFRRAAALKRPLVVALLCQALALPALCLLIAEAFSLPAKLSIGLMLISAVPGGLLANVFSHLVNGDLALNLTLTAINAVLSIASLPAILAFSITWFTGEGRSIPLQLDKFVAVVGLVLIPTAIGVAIRERFPGLARRLKRPVRVSAGRFWWPSPWRRSSADERRCRTTSAHSAERW